MGGLARLAQHLMAAVHVPRALHAADELPMGGVSDLTNRGDFDRLLISELAHDDLTLAVRVALNEALYLRRESPPRRPPPRRAVLVDCGIRLWGVGRVFAAAVAMALAAGADPRGELAVYRAAGDGVVPVDLASRRGVVALLEALEPHPHPGAALPAFLAAAGGNARNGGAEVEWLLVTHADVPADPEFARHCRSRRRRLSRRHRLVRRHCRPHWRVRPDRDRPRGRRAVCSAELSLDEILAPPPAAPAPLPLRAEDADPDLPAILTCDPLPLRLPYLLEPGRAVTSDKLGLFGTTADGRVLWWDGASRGARQLTDEVPPGRHLGVFVDQRREQLHVVTHSGNGNRLDHVAIDLGTRRIERRRFAMNAPRQAHFHEADGTLFLISRGTVRAVDLVTGVEYGRLHCPDAVWTNGRFFVKAGKRCALAVSGSRVTLEPVTGDAGIALLDGPNGPYLLKADGALDALDGKPPRPPAPSFPAPVSLVGVSPDGRRVAVLRSLVTLGRREPPGVYLCDSSRGGGWRLVPKEDVARLLVGGQIAWSLESRVQAQTAFAGVSAGETGKLWLVTPGGDAANVFFLNSAGDLDLGVSLPPRHFKAFEPCPAPPGRQYSLRVARWRDGSRAYLDGRGMLHLMSGGSAPEVSLVLANSALSGWASDGTDLWLEVLPRRRADGRAGARPRIDPAVYPEAPMSGRAEIGSAEAGSPAADAVRLPLALRVSGGPARPPAAWLIPGADAAGWVEEIAAWGVAAENFALYRVPASVRDRTCAGLLAVPPAGAAPAASPRGQAYRCLAGVLFIPAESELDPPVSDEEFAHAAALARGRPAPVDRPRRLHQGRRDRSHRPARRALPDRRGVGPRGPGGRAPPRLVSVEAEAPRTFEAFIDEGRDDIASESPGDAPPTPEEAGAGKGAASSLASLFKWLGGAGGKAAGKAGGKGGEKTGEGGGWLSKLTGRFQRRGASVPDVEAARRRELERLMRLLETDPDAGLRHALPLAGAGNRGVAPPGATLPPRQVDFDLASLGGGRPADAWRLSEEVRQRLREMYREAASRELRLGRHRRAAYVFAKLLGDYPAAADALRQGRHYREAAALYRDKLNDLASAAACLEAGGLLTEAIDLYLSFDQFEKAGDLSARIDRPGDAGRWWRRAVDQRVADGDRLGAAKLLDEKLAAPDEAVTVLREGWPHAPQSAACLQALFDLLGRAGRHEDARAAVADATGRAGERDALKLVARWRRCRRATRTRRSAAAPPTRPAWRRGTAWPPPGRSSRRRWSAP